MRKKRVVVVDDHQVVLEGMNLILSSANNIELVALCQSKQEFDKVEREHLKVGDIIIVDAQLNKDYHGIQLMQETPKTERYKWILFSAYVDKYLVFRAESAGFQACLSKEVPSGILLETILSVGNMPFFTYPPIEGQATERTAVEGKLRAYNNLTQREKSVMKVLTSGNSSKECAEILHISIHTLETHKKNIFRKFEVNSVAELLRIGIDLKI